MPADLTSFPLFDIIPFGYSEEEEEYPFRLCKENPWFGEKGRGQSGEYPLELAPQRLFGPVGVLRVRPLSRRRVLARPEAALREETANQRWYREACSPSVPCRDGGVFYARSKECVAV